MSQLDELQAYITPVLSSQELSHIDNIIIGTPLDDTLAGTSFNDLVIALEGDDLIIGSIGKDILIGNDGTDTVDYSDLGRAITLEAAGFVNKGRLGTDQLLNIEEIIGAKGQANTIDGSTSTSRTTSLDVDLSTNSLVVNGVPGLGTLKFSVVNFVNVIGTSRDDSIVGNSQDNLLIGGEGNDQIFGLNGNDTLRGDAGNDVIAGGSKSSLIGSRFDGNDILEGGSGNDTLIGGTGYDLLDGGTGVDTADYSTLGSAITLEAVGVVTKGRLAGTDQLLNIEEIIGAKGKANAIDASTGTSTTTSLDVDLSTNSLVVNGIPRLGTLKFTVVNFVNVTGTSQNDSIVGNSQDNLLIGGKGNDKLSGLDGKDTIISVDPTSFQPGINERDTLIGGADADKFVLGDQTNAYYLGNGVNFGVNDYAFLEDFQTGEDKIQLKKLENYIFGRNYIAVTNDFLSKDFDDSQLVATFDEIIKSNGTYDSSSQDLSVIFPSFDVIAIFSGSYNLSDIHFV